MADNTDNPLLGAIQYVRQELDDNGQVALANQLVVVEPIAELLPEIEKYLSICADLNRAKGVEDLSANLIAKLREAKERCSLPKT